MSAKKKTKAEAPDTRVVIYAEHFGRMLDTIDGLLVEGLRSYGMCRERIPSTGVASVPEVLSDIAIKLKHLRHFVKIAPGVKS